MLRFIRIPLYTPYPQILKWQKLLKKLKLGIVWHTTYSGNSFESMKASYGVNVSN